MLAEEVGIAPATLSRILSGKTMNPSFALVVSIVHAAGESVGWLLGERGYDLSADERKTMREATHLMERVAEDVVTTSASN